MTGKLLPAALFAVFATAVLQAADTLPVPQFLFRAGPVEGQQVRLTVPSGATGTVNGTVTFENNGFVFGEEPGLIDIPFDAAMLFGSTFTIVARIEPHGLDGHGSILNAGAPVGFGLVLHAHGHYAVSAGGAGQWTKVVAPKAVKTGAVQSVAVTFDGAFATIYVDGVESAKDELNAAPAAGQLIEIGSMGRKTDAGTVTDRALYRLEEVAVFSEVLTPEQISAIANGAPIPAQ